MIRPLSTKKKRGWKIFSSLAGKVALSVTEGDPVLERLARRHPIRKSSDQNGWQPCKIVVDNG